MEQSGRHSLAKPDIAEGKSAYTWSPFIATVVNLIKIVAKTGYRSAMIIIIVSHPISSYISKQHFGSNFRAVFPGGKFLGKIFRDGFKFEVKT